MHLQLALLPDQKYSPVGRALNDSDIIGFVGDGADDAPVITLADIGMTMGSIGSGVSIETADAAIQTDQLSKIPLAIRIAGFGMATMWEAIFADAGVAFIAVGKAVRIQHKEFNP